MNPMTNMKNILKLSDLDLKYGQKSSWHDQYKDSAWIFVGGLPYDLTEGDVLCIFSQYGEIVNINLVRDKISGKQKGYCFICFEDQRSTILTVDNLNGIKILGRTLRVDHVHNYKPPKDNEKLDEVTKRLHKEGCAPVPQLPVNAIKRENVERERGSGGDFSDGFRIPQRLPIRDNIKVENIKTEDISRVIKKEKKVKKEKKSKKSKKVKRNRNK